jgi:hypothetical protein
MALFTFSKDQLVICRAHIGLYVLSGHRMLESGISLIEEFIMPSGSNLESGLQSEIYVYGDLTVYV